MISFSHLSLSSSPSLFPLYPSVDLPALEGFSKFLYFYSPCICLISSTFFCSLSFQLPLSPVGFPAGMTPRTSLQTHGVSTEGNGFEPINLEILSPVAGNIAPPDLVKGEGDPSGVQSDPEILLLAGKPKKDIPTPTPTPTPTIFGPPIRQNPNVPEEAWDAYAGYPQPSDLPDLYIPGTQRYKPQTGGLCLKGKELFCCRWGSYTHLSTGKTMRGPIKCFKCRFLRRSIHSPPPSPSPSPSRPVAHGKSRYLLLLPHINNFRG